MKLQNLFFDFLVNGVVEHMVNGEFGGRGSAGPLVLLVVAVVCIEVELRMDEELEEEDLQKNLGPSKWRNVSQASREKGVMTYLTFEKTTRKRR